MDSERSFDAVGRYVGLIRSGQFCPAATARFDAVRELRAGPSSLGEGAVMAHQAKIQAMISAGADAEALHHEIYRPC